MERKSDRVNLVASASPVHRARDNRMQSKHKQTKCEHLADETLPDYSFLSRYHYAKSKDYLKRRYLIHP